VSSASVIRTDELVGPLLIPASIPPARGARLDRKVETAFTAKNDTGLGLLTTFQPSLGDTLPVALTHADVTPKSGSKVAGLRVKASLFGHNTPPQPTFNTDNRLTGYTNPNLLNTWDGLLNADSDLPVVALDSQYDQIIPGSFVLISRLIAKG